MVEFGQGVNYAVVAATALDTSFHEARGTINPVKNVSLGVQLTWFKQSLHFICHNASGSGNQTYICASIVYSCANHTHTHEYTHTNPHKHMHTHTHKHTHPPTQHHYHNH